MAHLVLHAPDGKRRSIALSSRPIRVGRSESCDIVLRDDAEVSRFHAEIWQDEDGQVMVADRGSKNGTRVDQGEPFHSTQNVAAQIIRIGEHEFRIYDAKRDAVQAPVKFTDEPATVSGETQFFPSSRGFDLSEQRLSLLMQLSERIGGVFDRKQLLEQALDACCEALHFERGLIALRTQRGDTELPVSRNLQRDENGEFRVSRTLLNRALVQGERAIVNNPATDLGENLSESLVRFPICSALCVPILCRDEILGVIYGDRTTQATTYSPADVDFLAAIAQHVGVGIANLRMLQEHVRLERMDAELDQARRIQKRLLPHGPLTCGPVRIEGYNQASTEVSGDYFDYFRLDDGRIGFVIADVTGHGLPAALLMANLQSALRVALTVDHDLADIAQKLNRLIHDNTDASAFITGIFGTIQPDAGTMEFVNAGHPLPVIFQNGRIVDVENLNGLPLGIETDETYGVYRFSEPLDALLCYTDGVSEAANTDGKLLGTEPVVERMRMIACPTTAELIEATRRLVRDYVGRKSSLDDDMTVLAMTYGAPVAVGVTPPSSA